MWFFSDEEETEIKHEFYWTNIGMVCANFNQATQVNGKLLTHKGGTFGPGQAAYEISAT